MDQLTGAAAQQLDVSDPDQRNKAVRATIQASTSLLGEAEHDRFAELAIFAEDETIPVTLLSLAVAGHWRPGPDGQPGALRPAGRPGPGDPDPRGRRRDHHPARRHPRLPARRLGAARLAQVHRVLLEAVAAGLPRAPAPAGDAGKVTAWWELPDDARYLWEHLIEHMLDAGRAVPRPRSSPRTCGGPEHAWSAPPRPARTQTWP